MNWKKKFAYVLLLLQQNNLLMRVFSCCDSLNNNKEKWFTSKTRRVSDFFFLYCSLHYYDINHFADWMRSDIIVVYWIKLSNKKKLMLEKEWAQVHVKWKKTSKIFAKKKNTWRFISCVFISSLETTKINK